MIILEKIGQGLAVMLLLILGLPVFCIYGLYIGIRDLIDVIRFYCRWERKQYYG
jgi:hypothetical protein